jgi:predicted transcriptional regulator
MKPKTIDDLIERVKSWPPGAQGDLAQAVMSIEADIERGNYEPYTPTPEEQEALERALKQADAGEFVTQEQIEAVFAKYRRS